MLAEHRFSAHIRVYIIEETCEIKFACKFWDVLRAWGTTNFI